MQWQRTKPPGAAIRYRGFLHIKDVIPGEPMDDDAVAGFGEDDRTRYNGGKRTRKSSVN